MNCFDWVGMIKVIVIDDSHTIRSLFTAMLSQDAGIDVVATAHDAYDAREKIRQYNPDVLTLDIEMPKMDGLAFLDKIMTLRPMPVIMASTLTLQGADITLQALEMGAVDYVTKPKMDDAQSLEHFAQMLVEKVKHAASVQVKPQAVLNTSKKSLLLNPTPIHPMLIGITSSTGGVEALRDIIHQLPANMPPIVITQHMPEYFTASFAKRLNSISAMHVQEASNGLRIVPGNVYVAPGNYHLAIIKRNNGLFCQLQDGELVSDHRPSGDVMFGSMAQIAHYMRIGIILTGMGQDGAKGLLALRQSGAQTLGQSEASCVVYGMPRVAKQLGAVEREVPLANMARELVQLCSSWEERYAAGS